MGKPEEAGVVSESPPDEADLAAKEVFGEDALRATEREHALSFFQAVKLYPAATGWSAFFSLGIIMTAFGPQILGSLLAEHTFQKDFGCLFEGEYIISAPWQTALSMGNPIVVLFLLDAPWSDGNADGYTFAVCVTLTASFISMHELSDHELVTVDAK
ncbi:hypothetical protein BDZ45DRAFT_737461 [Acephala macrosclerotiorum]|nr:hypothetical protein BDZ45DRAFT_737461 [Acephala macrosclerotiorum]